MASTLTNVATIFQQKCASQYLGDGAQEADNDLAATAGKREGISDGLLRTCVVPQNGTGAAPVITTAATRLYEVVVVSAGSSGYLQLYDGATAAVGTTALTEVYFFAANTTKAVRQHPGNVDVAAGFTTGLCVSVATVAKASAAIGTNVTSVTLVYK